MPPMTSLLGNPFTRFSVARHLSRAALCTCLLVSAVPAARANQTIRVEGVGSGLGKPVGTGLFEIAQARGFLNDEFGKDGIEFALTYTAGTGPAINEALAEGEADIGESGNVPIIIGLTGGLRAHVVLTVQTNLTEYLIARKDLGIDRVEDLKGHTVAVQFGTVPHLILTQILAAHGLSPKDVTLVNLQIPDAASAFSAKAVDAIVGTVSSLPVVDAGLGTVLSSSQGLGAEAAVRSSELVSDAFARKNPEIVERIVKVLVRTAAWARQPENRGALLALAAQSGVPTKYLAREIPDDMGPYFVPLSFEETATAYTQAQNFAFENHLVRRKADLRAFFDDRYLTAARR